MRFHHDLAINSHKDLYALTRKDEIWAHRLLPMPVLNDFITILTPEGVIKKEISLYKVLEDKISFFSLLEYISG